LKPFAKAWPSIDFINVEPYQLEPVDGQLQPVLDANDQLTPAASATEWGLLTEPAIFVVDADGTVRAAFEGAFADEELRAALAAVNVPAE
jgi:peroxiredoxin